MTAVEPWIEQFTPTQTASVPGLSVSRDVASRDVAAGDVSIRWRRGHDGAVHLTHAFTVATISDSAMIRALVALIDDGVLHGQDAFEAAATAIITTSGDSPADGWRAFYRNSVAELRAGASDFSPVHLRARSLVAGGSVLEVGCCFGFFALQCAQDGHSVSACDISPGAIALLDEAAADFDVRIDTSVGDARALPAADDSVDTVTLIHLLEHLDADDVRVAIAEALRVARRRVVVAVPFEEEPSPHFGHLQCLTVDDLHRWAYDVLAHLPKGTGTPEWRVFTDHGGWLVFDLA